MIALARIKNNNFVVGLICLILIIIIISIALYVFMDKGPHLYVAEARYEGKLVGVSYCVTENPLNLSKKEVREKLSETLFGKIVKKEDFFKIIKNIINIGSGGSSSCTNSMLRYRSLPESFQVSSFSVSLVNPNIISLSLAPKSANAEANSSIGTTELFIVYTDRTLLIVLDVLVLAILLVSKAASPGRSEELHQRTYKRLLALSYLSILMSIHFIFLLSSYLSVSSSLLIVDLALIVAVIMLAIYSMPLAIARIVNFYDDAREDSYDARQDRIYRLLVLFMLVGLAFLITYNLIYIFIKIIFITQTEAVSFQALSGIVALTIAIVYAIPFTLLNITRVEAVSAAYDVLLSTGLTISILEIIISLAIFRVMLLWVIALLAITTILLCYLFV